MCKVSAQPDSPSGKKLSYSEPERAKGGRHSHFLSRSESDQTPIPNMGRGPIENARKVIEWCNKNGRDDSK